MKIIEIGNTKIKVRNVREQAIDYLKDISENKDCYIDFGIDEIAKIIVDYIDELQKNSIKYEAIISYSKQRCDGYIEDLKEHYDCEYCDGAFASCRKVLQLAGEDIKKYE